MVGMGSVDHLEKLVNQTDSVYRQTLWNGTAFRTRPDVFLSYGPVHGNLTVGRNTGFAGKGAHFGPELMIGWTLGDSILEDVYLIKAAYGGRSLAIDFRSPGAGEGPYEGVKPHHYGWQYRDMVDDIAKSLEDIATNVPTYNADTGFEICGFIWFQGWNDMIDWSFVNEYASNLIHFVRDVRKELDSPELPFIVGELGMHGLYPEGRGADRVRAFRTAQRAVTLMDEFRNSSIYVPTAQYAVNNGTSYGGGYHYNGRADTYFHIGQDLGKAAFSFM